VLAYLTDDREEPVGLHEITPQGITVECARNFEPKSGMPVTVRVPFPGGAQAIDLRAVVVQRALVGRERWRYGTTWEGNLPPNWRQALPSMETERRLAWRHPVLFKILIPATGQRGLGRDISLHGLGTQAAFPLPSDEPVDLKMEFDIEGRPPLRLSLEATPVYSVPLDKRNFRIGMRISHMEPQVAETLNRYLKTFH
jgi:hypothetical protein